MTDNDWVVGAEFLFSESSDAAMVMRGDLEQVGTTADGYPIYESVRMPSFVLTNSNENPRSTVVSFSLEREWDNFYLSLGYSHTNTKDVQPMTSSVAFSNYINRAFFDPQEDVISTSNYEIEHRFAFTSRWMYEFGNDLDLTIALYGHA